MSSDDTLGGRCAAVPEALVKEALAVSEHAYAPYSGYRVGAALLCEDGSLFLGCNVENASYGLTICAERSALVGAVSAGHRQFVALAVVASRGEPDADEAIGVASMCGACRQFLREFGADIQVYLADARGNFQHTDSSLLLPGAFDGSVLRGENPSTG